MDQFSERLVQEELQCKSDIVDMVYCVSYGIAHIETTLSVYFWRQHMVQRRLNAYRKIPEVYTVRARS